MMCKTLLFNSLLSVVLSSIHWGALVRICHQKMTCPAVATGQHNPQVIQVACLVINGKTEMPHTFKIPSTRKENRIKYYCYYYYYYGGSENSGKLSL